MKRRPGVERRRRRLANEQYYTSYFGQKIGDSLQLRQSTYKRQTGEIAANYCGWYFEACVLQALNKKTGEEYFFDVFDVDLDENQKKAVAIFSKANGVALQQKQNIEQGAMTVAENWSLIVKKAIGRIPGLNSNITVSSIASQNGKGNPLGDLDVRVNEAIKQRIVLELKWQESPDAAIKWFTSLKEDILFVGAFKEYLKGNLDTYWTNTVSGRKWQQDIEIGAFYNFLKQYNPSPSLLNYLVQKGNLKNSKPENQYDSKLVIHGSSAGITITGIDELARNLDMNVKGVSFKKGKKGTPVMDSRLRVNKRGHYGIYFVGSENEELALIALTGYQKRFLSANVRNATTKNGIKKETIDEANFSFTMYIAQKMLNQQTL